MVDSSLTQALAAGISGIVLMAFNVMALGPVVDYFIWFGGTLVIDNAVMRDAMLSIQLFGSWFYIICWVMSVLFVAYPIIYVIFRHRYMSVEPQQEEQQIMGQ